MCVRQRPFDSERGGLGFFGEKKSLFLKNPENNRLFLKIHLKNSFVSEKSLKK
jgi:hypothetical protein